MLTFVSLDHQGIKGHLVASQPNRLFVPNSLCNGQPPIASVWRVLQNMREGLFHACMYKIGLGM